MGAWQHRLGNLLRRCQEFIVVPAAEDDGADAHGVDYEPDEAAEEVESDPLDQDAEHEPDEDAGLHDLVNGEGLETALYWEAQATGLGSFIGGIHFLFDYNKYLNTIY